MQDSERTRQVTTSQCPNTTCISFPRINKTGISLGENSLLVSQTIQQPGVTHSKGLRQRYFPAVLLKIFKIEIPVAFCYLPFPTNFILLLYFWNPWILLNFNLLASIKSSKNPLMNDNALRFRGSIPSTDYFPPLLYGTLSCAKSNFVYICLVKCLVSVINTLQEV